MRLQYTQPLTQIRKGPKTQKGCLSVSVNGDKSPYLRMKRVAGIETQMSFSCSMTLLRMCDSFEESSFTKANIDVDVNNAYSL